MCPVLFARLYCCFPSVSQAFSQLSVSAVLSQSSCLVLFISVVFSQYPLPLVCLCPGPGLRPPARPRLQPSALRPCTSAPWLPLPTHACPTDLPLDLPWYSCYRLTTLDCCTILSVFNKPLFSSWTWSGDWFSVQQSWHLVQTPLEKNFPFSHNLWYG